MRKSKRATPEEAEAERQKAEAAIVEAADKKRAQDELERKRADELERKRAADQAAADQALKDLRGEIKKLDNGGVLAPVATLIDSLAAIANRARLERAPMFREILANMINRSAEMHRDAMRLAGVLEAERDAK